MTQKWVCQTNPLHVFSEPTEDGFCPEDPIYHGILILQETSAAPDISITKSLEKEYDTKPVDLIKPKVFISYAHKDKTYFDIFEGGFKSHSMWDIWTDRNIEIGEDWYDRIQDSIENSDIAVLLISADFISSIFIREHEYQKFNELRNSKSGFIFCPILLRDVDFTRWEQLSKMQSFVAYGDDYGVNNKRGQIIPFATLCKFDSNRELIPNDNLDTYFKNLVLKVQKDWVKKGNVFK